jgi:hypothetical protein
MLLHHSNFNLFRKVLVKTADYDKHKSMIEAIQLKCERAEAEQHTGRPSWRLFPKILPSVIFVRPISPAFQISGVETRKFSDVKIILCLW